MSISVQCAGCEKKFTGKDELAGKRVKCPKCGHRIEVPVARAPSRPGATEPLPEEPTAKAAERRAAPPVEQGRRARWPWYAGGVALCLVAGAALVLSLSGKHRGKESPDPYAPASEGGITQEKLVGKWSGTFTDGSIELEFTNDQIPSYDLKVVRVQIRPSSGRDDLAVTGYQVNAAGNEVKIGGDNSAVAKPTSDGALILSGKIHSPPNVFHFSETRLERTPKGGRTPEKPLAQVAVGIQSTPVYEKQDRKRIAAYLGTGSRVDVYEMRDDMVRIHVRQPSWSQEDMLRKDTLLGPLHGDALMDLLAYRWWIRRCHLCTVEELQRRKANGLVPRATLRLKYQDGAGFSATDGEMEVRNGKMGIPEGTALWCDKSAFGKTFAVSNAQFQCKPDTLFYWQGGKVHELGYYSVATASEKGWE
jgi:DNA-directed RNA polymerase subunit RPC12/RpoP